MAVALFMIEEDENRRALRRDRVFRDRWNPLDVYDDAEILRRYRFTRPVMLCSAVQDTIPGANDA